ncbi:hypothetical protein D9Q98_003159 [Chlorella vulgaris]|uniref:Uncharacterized protein n=1 Tax=Chlorella vulgaris TaxID=3077 RepID=A0A9D4TS31_CHLVU|nr:hypothetical protein D9Q98_003159 [Chlorella vulgaris]
MQACMSLQTSLLRPCSVLRKVQLCRSTAPSLRAAATRPRRAARKAVLALAASDDATADSLAAVAQLDALIDTLMAKKNPQDLAQCVAENIMSFDQRFWLRLATRSDAASDEEQRQQLSALARVVMQLVDAVVKRSNEQLSESTSLLQGILQAAADPQTGEWDLPLAPEKLEAMRKVMAAQSEGLDESLLAACYSWMRKSAEEKLDGMVVLLQKVLQLYACQQLSTGQGAAGSRERSGGEAAVDELLAADESMWTRLLRQQVSEAGLSEPAFMEALQRRMEAVVLGLPSGSYAQRVQAEYLKELEERAKGTFAELAQQGA